MESQWSGKDVVEALYRGLLKRDSDPSGLEAHVNYLSNNPGSTGLEHVVDGFIRSEEFKFRLNEAQFKSITLSMLGGPKVEDEPIHHVMSVGASCSTSGMLQRWWLRRSAGPFDWMFSSLRMVDHVLRDDFRTFLDPVHMEPVVVSDRKATHHHFYTPYADFLPGMPKEAPVFLHHDLIANDRGHFERAAERTRRLLQKRTLLVGVYQDFPGVDGDFWAMTDYLTATAPQTRLMAFVVSPTAGLLMPDMALYNQNGPHRLYRIKAVGGIGEVGFENMYDEMAAMRAVHQFNFDLGPL